MMRIFARIVPTVFLLLLCTAALRAQAPSLRMVEVPGGSFPMGYASGDDDERPVRTVTVSAFLMGATEVTQAQFRAVMGYNPSRFRDGPEAPGRPVDKVSWSEAIVFCNELSILSGLQPVYYEDHGLTAVVCDYGEGRNWHRGGDEEARARYDVPGGPVGLHREIVAPVVDPSANGYRLPTEIEWERAARGRDGRGAVASLSAAAAGPLAWFRDVAGGITHPAGGKQPNDLGIYDLYGNVWEWCWDLYGTYGSAPLDDPEDAGPWSRHVQRGGSWAFAAPVLRPSYRWYGAAFNRLSDAGFRVARHPGGSGVEGLAMLQLAATGTAAELKAAVAKGWPLEVRDEKLRTPLMVAAASNRDPAAIRALLDGKARAAAVDANGDTALQAAAAANPNPAVLEALLAVPALAAGKPPAVLRSELYLEAAASNPNPAVLASLEAAGVDARRTDGLKRSALHVAAATNPSPDVVSRLLAAGLDAGARESRGKTPLMMAAATNPEPRIIALLARDAALVKSVSDERKSAICYAAASNPSSQVLAALLKAGADVNDAAYFVSPLELALEGNPSLEVVKLLYASGGRISAASQARGVTALTRAAATRNPAVLAYVASRGEKPNVKDPDGRSPLMLACDTQRGLVPGVIAELLKAGADVNARDREGRTALMYAVQGGADSFGVIELLLKAGTDVNAADQYGRTVLHHAVTYEHYPEMRTFLVERGARSGVKDSDGVTADERYEAFFAPMVMDSPTRRCEEDG